MTPAAPAGRLVLGLETGGDHLGVSLVEWYGDGEWRLREASVSYRGHRHADVILAEIARVLANHGATPGDLALIAPGRGPGGFTGVRVGLSTAVGLTLATGVAVWPVCSLQSLGAEAAVASGLAGDPPPPVAVAIDARRGEVYGALHRFTAAGALVETLIAPMSGHIDVFRAQVTSCLGEATRVVWTGSGAEANGLAVPGPNHHGHPTRHAVIAATAFEAAGWDPAALPPLDAAYVRASEAEVNAEKALAKRLAMGN